MPAWGNITFVGGLTIFLIGITYALHPYGNDPRGGGSPWVLASMVIGILLLIAFPFIENRVEDPMFFLFLTPIEIRQ